MDGGLLDTGGEKDESRNGLARMGFTEGLINDYVGWS